MKKLWGSQNRGKKQTRLQVKKDTNKNEKIKLETKKKKKVFSCSLVTRYNSLISKWLIYKRRKNESSRLSWMRLIQLRFHHEMFPSSYSASYRVESASSLRRIFKFFVNFQICSKLKFFNITYSIFRLLFSRSTTPKSLLKVMTNVMLTFFHPKILSNSIWLVVHIPNTFT